MQVNWVAHIFFIALLLQAAAQVIAQQEGEGLQTRSDGNVSTR